jgi:transcriptional regulator with XRE-family HTH domain
MVLETGAELMANTTKSTKIRNRIDKIESEGDLSEQEIADLATWETSSSAYIAQIGEVLGNLRVKKGLLQKDIARVLGRSKSWVGQIENGANQDHRSAKLYAHALGVEFASVVAMAEFTVLRQAEREEMARKLNLDVSPVEDQHDPSKTEH